MHKYYYQIIGIAKNWAAKHVAGWTDESHRDLLQRCGAKLVDGKYSAKSMNARQLEAVLKAYEGKGWPREQKGDQKPPTRTLANDPQSRKVRALWLMLHQLGEVKNPSEEALAAYARRLTGVDALQWVKNPYALIESLKSWAMRVLPTTVAMLYQAFVVAQQSFGTLLNPALVADVESTQRALREGSAGFDEYRAAYEALVALLAPLPNAAA